MGGESSLKGLSNRLHKKLKGIEFGFDEISVKSYKVNRYSIDEIDLSTHLTRTIKIGIPLVSSPMDTITESDTSIALALWGGVGILHRNLLLENQVEKVEEVKRFTSGLVTNPQVLSPYHRILDVYDIKDKYSFSSVPITEDGTLESRLVGIVTNRDIRLETNLNKKLNKIMTTDLITFEVKDLFKKDNSYKKYGLQRAHKLLKDSKKDKILIVDEEYKLVGLVSIRDLIQEAQYGNATKDEGGRLRIFAAIGAGKDHYKRTEALVNVGVDGIVIDHAHGLFVEMRETLKYYKKKYGDDLQIIAGNIVDKESTEYLIKWGVDGIREGMGVSEICTTTQRTGPGRKEGISDYECSLRAREMENKYGLVPVMADGKIRDTGEITLALALGAHNVMLGSMFAATKEAPGEYEWDDDNHYFVKVYRGMGSMEVMESMGSTGNNRYGTEGERVKMPEGRTIKVPDKGSLYDLIPRYLAGVRQGFQKLGCGSIEELHKAKEVTILPYPNKPSKGY